MRIFVTGATGFIGSAVVKELIGAGHQVLGLSRSEEGAKVLADLGAEVTRGSVNDLELMRAAAAESDGVIHLAFNHDFSRYQQNCEDDRRVIAALASGLAGTKRPLIVTSGTGMTNTGGGQSALENGTPHGSNVIPRAASEEAAVEAASAGCNVSVVRLPQVHDTRRQGFVSYVIGIYRKKGICAYVGDGQTRWPAAHVTDVARLYRLAVERAEPNARYHAVAEEGISMRDIAQASARRLGLPTQSIAAAESEAFFGFLAAFVGRDLPASSAHTQEVLRWTPRGPGMIEDLEHLELAPA